MPSCLPHVPLGRYTEFSVEGAASIHLTGYYMPEYEMGEHNCWQILFNCAWRAELPQHSQSSCPACVAPSADHGEDDTDEDDGEFPGGRLLGYDEVSNCTLVCDHPPGGQREAGFAAALPSRLHASQAACLNMQCLLCLLCSLCLQCSAACPSCIAPPTRHKMHVSCLLCLLCCSTACPSWRATSTRRKSPTRSTPARVRTLFYFSSSNQLRRLVAAAGPWQEESGEEYTSNGEPGELETYVDDIKFSPALALQRSPWQEWKAESAANLCTLCS